MKKINIAIDGFSGTGKSSTAKQVASSLEYTYIDTGAMYRAVTLHLLQKDVDLDIPEEITRNIADLELTFNNQRIVLNGVDVEDKIRETEVTNVVSKVSAIPAIRLMLTSQQQEIGKNKGVVMDGRDIGTTVFPDAELKIFMSADLEIRALRRQKELQEKGIHDSLESIQLNLQERDELDSNREVSPLRKAEDAIQIDTTHLTLNEQIQEIVVLAKKAIDED